MTNILMNDDWTLDKTAWRQASLDDMAVALVSRLIHNPRTPLTYTPEKITDDRLIRELGHRSGVTIQEVLNLGFHSSFGIISAPPDGDRQKVSSAFLEQVKREVTAHAEVLNSLRVTKRFLWILQTLDGVIKTLMIAYGIAAPVFAAKEIFIDRAVLPALNVLVALPMVEIEGLAAKSVVRIGQGILLRGLERAAAPLIAEKWAAAASEYGLAQVMVASNLGGSARRVAVNADTMDAVYKLIDNTLREMKYNPSVMLSVEGYPHNQELGSTGIYWWIRAAPQPPGIGPARGRPEFDKDPRWDWPLIPRPIY